LLLIFLVVSLVNLEMTLAHAAPGERYRIKLEVLGCGAFLAVLIFYYSQGVLYRVIDMNLAPVRSVLLIVSVLMVACSRQLRGAGVKVCVSRHLAYRSFVLVSVGGYLLGLGLVGQGLSYYGDGLRRTAMVSWPCWPG
jgi:hypothetical protein